MRPMAHDTHTVCWCISRFAVLTSVTVVEGIPREDIPNHAFIHDTTMRMDCSDHVEAYMPLGVDHGVDHGHRHLTSSRHVCTCCQAAGLIGWSEFRNHSRLWIPVWCASFVPTYVVPLVSTDSVQTCCLPGLVVLVQ